MHFLFVIADSGEDNDRNFRINFADEGDEGNSIYLWHPKIDNHHFALIVGEPGGCLESLGQRLASMAFLPEVSNEKSGDGGIVIDNEKLEGIAVQKGHGLYNCHIYYKH